MTQVQKHHLFGGVITALVTPLRKTPSGSSNEIDEDALAALCESQIQAGITALIPSGTTGESGTISDEEKKRLFDIVLEVARGRVKVIAGIGSTSTAHALHMGMLARECGVDGVLAVTPYYYRPSQEGLYQHYQTLTSLDIPLVLYNVPGRTGCDLLPQTVARLCEFPQVVAIKEASGHLQRAQQLYALLGERISILSGEDALNFPMYCIGAQGCVSVVSNIAPKLQCDIFDSFENKEYETARTLHYRSLPLCEALFPGTEPSPIPVKTALSMMGRMEAEFRLPLHPMGGASAEALRITLVKEGLL